MQRFTSAFEETKRELEGVTNDMEHSFSLQLATKLNSEELPQKLQEASLVSRASLQAHVKQVSLVLCLCGGTYTSAFWHADVLANTICIGAFSCVSDMQICYVMYRAAQLQQGSEVRLADPQFCTTCSEHCQVDQSIAVTLQASWQAVWYNQLSCHAGMQCSWHPVSQGPA